MPYGDKTGPLGQGPRTGRGAGLCAGFAEPGDTNPGQRRGMRRGARGGFGRGWRNQFNATGLRGWQRAAKASTEDAPSLSATTLHEREIATLKAQAESLQTILGQMRKRIEELEAGSKLE